MTASAFRLLGALALASATGACIEIAPTDLWATDDGGGAADGGGVSTGGSGDGGGGGVGGEGGSGGAAFEALPPCSPTTAEPCANVVELDASRYGACARFDDGALRCWGGNDAGQLGIATRPSTAFEPPTLSTLWGFDQVTLGNAHGCGLDGDEVYCWGDNQVGQLGLAGASTAIAKRAPIPPALDVVSKEFTTCARTNEGLWCWGLDLNGQNTWPPGQSGTYSPPFGVSGLPAAQLVDVEVSYLHACALLDDHQVRCWGRGQAYRLGTGNEDDQLLPAPVLKTYPDPVHELAVGHEFGCVIAGTPPAAYCWGYFNSFHYYAAGPVLYDGWVDKPFVDVQLGFRTMCVLYEDQTVRCSGTNKAGQIPSSNQEQEPSMLAIADLGHVTQLAVGRFHMCVLNTDNEVLCWGRNAEGQLGRGFLSQQEEPAPVVWGAR